MNRRKLLAFFSLAPAIGVAASDASTADFALKPAGDRKELGDGDMVVINVPGRISQNCANTLGDRLKERFKTEMGISVGVLIVQEGASIEVLRKKEA